MLDWCKCSFVTRQSECCEIVNDLLWVLDYILVADNDGTGGAPTR